MKDLPHDPDLFFSIDDIPGVNAKAMFTVDNSQVFREDQKIIPSTIDKNVKYMPWGSDNRLPYNILDLVEADETLATCQIVNAEFLYGSGLTYHLDKCSREVRADAEKWIEENPIESYFLGACQDIKLFGFAVSVIILSKDRKRICRLIRKEACYCRFAPVDESGRSKYVVYANFRTTVTPTKYEKIELLDPDAPLLDLRERMAGGSTCCKYAILTKIPTVDSTYYPIPHYGALFKGKWYDIKRLIALAKEAKLRNSAPIKYHIEVSEKYWFNIWRNEGITDRVKQRERMIREKENMLNFLTRAENSGKVLFSQFYVTPDGKEQSDIRITKIDSGTEGGDYATDIQEAVNMVCFTMRVHSNLVGSVPGKAQTNNSGSDKRELYTISQAIQKPYRDVMFGVHKLIIAFNGWRGAVPCCPFIQLTTLDEHTDAKKVDISTNND